MISARNVERGATTLREELAGLREAVVREALAIYESWHPPIERRAFRIAARNLASYVALRRHDVRALQGSLTQFGLSPLDRCEMQVMPALDAGLRTMSYVAGEGVRRSPHYARPSQCFRGERLLQRNVDELFGTSKRRPTSRVMATLSSEAATHAPFVQDLLERGMNCARIDAARDAPDVWRAMISNVRAASEATGRYCAVLVDLAGPRMHVEDIELRAADEHVRAGDVIVLAHDVYGPRVPGAPRVISRVTEVLEELEPGHRVVIDEGRIGARVERADKNGAVLRVDRASATGETLRAHNGLNFPDTPVSLSPLTVVDYHVLDVVADEADLIGYSIVHGAEDVRLLQDELRKRRSGPLPGIILKIDTARAVANLPSLIVQSARFCPTAALFVGEIKEEFRSICNAASLPILPASEELDSRTLRQLPARGDRLLFGTDSRREQ